MNYNDERDFSSYETDEEVYGLNNGGFVKFNSEQTTKKVLNRTSKKGPGKLYFVCLWIAFLLSALGITVSIFTSVSRSNLKKEIESATVNYSLKVQREAGREEMSLLKDSQLKTAISGSKEEKCIDSEGNSVCQIYKVTIENNSDYLTYFKSGFELKPIEGSSYQNLKWAEITNDETPMIYGELKDMSITDWKTSYGVGANTYVDFYLVVWVSDNDVDQNALDYGSFNGNITFEALSGDTITSTFSGN